MDGWVESNINGVREHEAAGKEEGRGECLAHSSCANEENEQL